MIRIEELNKKYKTDVFINLDLTINDGEVIGIIGPSGTGKSVLLRELLLLERPDSGHIYVDDIDICDPKSDLDAVRKKIGMVFQDYNLFNHLTVLENVMCGFVHIQKLSHKESYEKAMELLNTINLADKAFEYPKTLSGGQKQRVAIARALAVDPSVILFDEPTSFLDITMRGEVESVIRILKDTGHTIVLVSHELELVQNLCTRVCFLNGGKVYEEGTPKEIFEHPQKTKTRRFIRALRVLEFNIESKTFDFLGMQTTISQFAYRNSVPSHLINRLSSIMEELCQMVIIQPKIEGKLKASFEYNSKEKNLEGNVLFTEPLLDPDDPHYFISWPIINKRASEIRIEQTDDPEFINKISIDIY